MKYRIKNAGVVTILFCVLRSAFWCLAFAAMATPCEASKVVVTVTGGQIAASSDLTASLRVFKAVPFAAPLVGALRWQAPQVFAAQGMAVLRALGLPDDGEHVNPHGGAIALGHPLGMSGVRLALTAVRQLQRAGGLRCVRCV